MRGTETGWDCEVAPYAGAWIEILCGVVPTVSQTVAPYAGAWIEMLPDLNSARSVWSLPTRERGLKL